MWRLPFQPLFEARLDFLLSEASVARRADEIRNHAIELQRGIRGRRVKSSPNINAAAPSQYDPTALCQIPVGRADGVGMNPKPSSEGTDAGESLAGVELLAQDCE